MLAWKTLNGEKNTWAHRLRTRSLYEKRYHRRLDGNNLELFFVQEMVTIEKLFLSLTQSLLQRLYTTNRNNILMMFCPSFYTHITLRAIYKCSLIRRTKTYLQLCPSYGFTSDLSGSGLASDLSDLAPTPSIWLLLFPSGGTGFPTLSRFYLGNLVVTWLTK